MLKKISFVFIIFTISCCLLHSSENNFLKEINNVKYDLSYGALIDFTYMFDESNNYTLDFININMPWLTLINNKLDSILIGNTLYRLNSINNSFEHTFFTLNLYLELINMYVLNYKYEFYDFLYFSMLPFTFNNDLTKQLDQSFIIGNDLGIGTSFKYLAINFNTQYRYYINNPASNLFTFGISIKILAGTDFAAR